MKTNDIKILLVDDEPDILEIVGYNLKNEGYTIHTANNGLKAIEKAIKHKHRRFRKYNYRIFNCTWRRLFSSSWF
jgi:CheY-like chemotaxis protein